MKLDKVTESVFANTEGETGCNVGVIILKDKTVAVDSQFPVSGKEFRQSIEALTDKPVTHLLLTHYHGDHVFGAKAFEDCEIVSHRLVKEIMEKNLTTEWADPEKMIETMRKNRPERAWLYEGFSIFLPTKSFEDRFSLDGEIEMIHTGGHTAGSSIVHFPKEKVLFAGDLVFAKTFPWAGDPTVDPDAWIEAFKKILGMDIETIIPGHGPMCDKSEVEVQLEFFTKTREMMRELIADGATIEEAVAYDGYPEFYRSEGPERRDDSLKQWYRVWATR